MMRQFVVWHMRDGSRWLMRVDLSHYDKLYGFFRPICMIFD